MSSMTLPVVIPVYGRDGVFATIGFLRSQTDTAQLRFIVIDNGNSAALSSRLRDMEADDCHVISFTENRGGSAAYIAGVEYAMSRFPESPYVWLLDDDAKPDERTLPGLCAEMDRLVRKDMRVASVGSAVVRPDMPDRIVECGADFSPLLAHAWPKLRGRTLSKVGGVTLRVDFAAACSLLLNVAAVRELGFWEDVFIHFDDIEWGVRATLAGWHNYATTHSVVRHPEFDPKKAGAWVCYFDARNQYWFAAKFGPLHVAVVWLKNRMKDIRAVWTGVMKDGNAYRELAWRDYRAGVRRSRKEAVSAVEDQRR